jgi:hypothetical protein
MAHNPGFCAACGCAGDVHEHHIARAGRGAAADRLSLCPVSRRCAQSGVEYRPRRADEGRPGGRKGSRKDIGQPSPSRRMRRHERQSPGRGRSLDADAVSEARNGKLNPWWDMLRRMAHYSPGPDVTQVVRCQPNQILISSNRRSTYSCVWTRNSARD